VSRRRVEWIRDRQRCDESSNGTFPIRVACSDEAADQDGDRHGAQEMLPR
jgi:hypothetical protein